jgi:myosin protein heavy chain
VSSLEASYYTMWTNTLIPYNARDSVELLDRLEQAAREMKAKEERLTTITEASADYETLIKRKEADIADLKVDLDAAREQIIDLKKLLRDTDLTAEAAKRDLETSVQSNEKSNVNLVRVQQELDGLRKLMSAKRDEDVQRREAEESREQELTRLRDQLQQATREDQTFREASHRATQLLEKDMKDAQTRVSQQIITTQDLEARLSEARNQLDEQTSLLSSTAKVTRALEVDLADSRKRLIARDGEYDAVVKAKEVSLLPRKGYRKSWPELISLVRHVSDNFLLPRLSSQTTKTLSWR